MPTSSCAASSCTCFPTDGFQRIRHYGFLANGHRKAKLAMEAKAKADRQLKESSDHDYQTTIAGLNADIKRMRDDRARSRFVPAAPAGSRSVGLACFDRADLERTLQQFDEAITGLIAEGDADAVGLNVARSWASGIRSGTSLGSPASIRP